MLKILNTSQTRDLDAFTIANAGMKSIDLMEKASLAFVQWFVARFDATRQIAIVCGTGNNGGDGLAIARILKEWGYLVKVFIVRGNAKETDDFKINLSRADQLKVSDFDQDSFSTFIQPCEIFIDAIFGSGLTRPAEGTYAQAIEAINAASGIRIAVDIPSGLFSDKHSKGAIIHADYTVSFQLPKLALMFPENAKYVGEWCLVDIGLDKTFIKDAASSFYYVTLKGIRKLIKKKSKFDHKGINGRGLLISGSHGKMGACILSSRGALRTGIGLLTVHVPATGYSILQTAVPEAMISQDIDDNFFTSVPALGSYDVIGIGPGLGQEPETAKALHKVLEQGKAMVIDADALNILGTHPELMHIVPPGSLLTPHPGEFERLVGGWKDDFDRLEKQRALAKKLNCVVILKGANSSIALPDGQVYFNSTGNPGMATGGSGDVLTGILTALLAQKYPSTEAALIGVFLHGFAGDLAAREMGMNSLIASDIVDNLPLAFKEICRGR